jgi:hypothetical protein
MITESPTLNEHPITASSPLSMRQPVITTRLRNENETEVLAFLAERPVHNAIMTGLIHDNGIESKFNRGTSTVVVMSLMSSGRADRPCCICRCAQRRRL